MTSKTRIAVLVAALFLGAQAGIAALEQEPPIASAESEAPAQEQQAEAATEPAAPEAASVAEQPSAVSQVAGMTQVPRARESNVFPRSPNGSDMLPGLAAYLEQRDAVLSQLVARGDVFPRSLDGSDLLPGLVAYLDQREATLVASAQAQQPASAAPAAESRQLTAPVALGLHQQSAGTSN